MKLSYDPTVDALFLRFSDEVTRESEEIKPGIVLDFDDAGHIVAIEILDAKQQLSQSAFAGLLAAE